jgi:hypothetical protein
LFAAALGSALAVWPTMIVAGIVVACVVAAALRAPEQAFLVSILLLASEGSLKAMLTDEGTPFTVSAAAVGAAVLDLCLLTGFLALFRRGSAARLKQVWVDLPRSARIALGLLVAWIAVSAIQALVIGSLIQGLDGFRLVQLYVVTGVLGALLVGRLPEGILISLLLSGLLVVSGYAVFRIVTGPSTVERSYNLSRAGIETYGGVGRAAGSFSAAAGLASYLVPAASFAFVVALAVPRYRLLATAVFGFAVVGIIDSYVRIGVVALVLGILLGGGLLVAQSRWTRRQRLVLLGAVLSVIVAGAIGTAIASRASPDLMARARVFVHPLGDRSTQMRLTTWRKTLEEVGRHPLGSGVGSVGRASAYGRDGTVIADNSYLKILREQGWLGGPIFIAGVIVLLVALGLASLDRSRTFSPIAVGALAGAFSFLMLGTAGEYIEQPGKALAWLFLGLAALEIARARANAREPEPLPQAAGHRMTLSKRVGRVSPTMFATCGAAMCLLVAVPVALTLARASRFVASINATPRDAQSSDSAFAASVRRLLKDPMASNGTVQAARVDITQADFAGRLRTIPTAAGVLVTVWGRTPDEADRLANALAPRLAQAAKRAEVPPIVVAPGPPSRPTRLADRVIDALPGRFPRRLEPVRVGVTGFVAGLLAWSAIALLWGGGPATARARQIGTRMSETETLATKASPVARA